MMEPIVVCLGNAVINLLGKVAMLEGSARMMLRESPVVVKRGFCRG